MKYLVQTFYEESETMILVINQAPRLGPLIKTLKAFKLADYPKAPVRDSAERRYHGRGCCFTFMQIP